MNQDGTGQISQPSVPSTSPTVTQPSASISWQWQDSHSTPSSTSIFLFVPSWKDYDAATSQLIETQYQHHLSVRGPHVIPLIHGDFATRGGYTIDFAQMYQRSNKTGFTRQIRRALVQNPPPVQPTTLVGLPPAVPQPTTIPVFPPNNSGPAGYPPTLSTPAMGQTPVIQPQMIPQPQVSIPLAQPLAPTQATMWLWQADRKWEPYDPKTSLILEAYYQNLLKLGWTGATPVNNLLLDHDFYGNQGGYEIDFQKGEQRKLSTNYVRKVQRVPPMHHMANVIPSQPVFASQPTVSSAPQFHSAPPNGLASNTNVAPINTRLYNSSPIPQTTQQQHKKDPKEKFLELTNANSYKAPSEKESKDTDCPICMDSLVDPGKEAYSLECNHSFHLECILPVMKESSVECPICRKSFGIRVGNQPPGEMTFKVSPHDHVDGYTNCGMIVVTFNIPSGTQGPEHPNPGIAYEGTKRVAYLPDNQEGREVLELFKIAWERRLIFTVGRSITTSRDNQVVWNSIHMKTSPSGGVAAHGFPDDTYFARVKGELKDVGVV